MTFEDLRIKTKPGTTRYYTTCPQCNDTRKKHKDALCLTVNDEPDNRWYKCHHCGWSGNLDLQGKFSEVQTNSKMPKEIQATYSKEVREYLKKRGIDTRIAMKEKIFEYNVGPNPIIGFPFFINMTLVNVKYFNVRWKPDNDMTKWWQMDRKWGTKAIFLGMQSICFTEEEVSKKKRTVIICEGEWDWLTWKQCRYNNVLSVPQGAPNPKSKNFQQEFSYIEDNYVKSFLSRENVDQIIFSADNDEPGKFLRDHLALVLGKDRCKYINYPVGYKDINEVLVGNPSKELPALGEEGVKQCIENLSSFPLRGIIKPSDLREELEIYASEGFTPGLGIGIEKIDRLYTLKKKRVTFITGVPGSGKSVYVRWYLGEFVRHNIDLNIKWALFTPENRPVSREYAKIAEVMTGQSFRQGYNNSMPPDMRRKTMDFIEKHFYIISPDRLNHESWGGSIEANRINTLASIFNYIKYLKTTENIYGFVIDAWNKIEHEQPKYMTETQFISQQLDYVVDFSDVYDLHAMIIVHPRKVDQQGINYKMPSLYDIKGSSAWKEKADIGIVVHRYKYKRKDKMDIPRNAEEDDKYKVVHDAPTILRTEKIRFEEEGIEDRIKLFMDPRKGGRFFVIDEEKPPLSTVPKLNPPRSNDEDEEKTEPIFLPVKGDKDDLPF